MTKIIAITYNMKGYLSFLLLYFEYCQIWLNTLMDNHHLRNITKLEEEKTHTHTLGGRGHLVYILSLILYFLNK
jgi:hypothetical protein